MRVGQGLKNFDALKMMFNVTSVCLGVKRELDEIVVVSTLMYGAEIYRIKMDARHNLDVMKVKSYFTEYVKSGHVQ